MNVQEALALRLPGAELYGANPDALPPGLYVVITEGQDGPEGAYHADEAGYAPQARSRQLLLTLYGEQGTTVFDLQAAWDALCAAARQITEHPGLPPLSRCSLGMLIPPQPAPPAGTRRPWCSVRVVFEYVA